MSFYNYVLVGFGGALGAILRVIMSNILPPSFVGIPISILIINIIGGLFIGIMYEILFLIEIGMIENIKYFCVTGLIGGFTTFSAFTLEIHQLIEKQKYLHALSYVILSVILSLIFFYCGTKLVKLLKPY